jgi:predicted AAA+ superfamily ATPase
LRRCGKSTILRQYWEHLISQQKIKTNQIIYFDFNDIALSELSYKQIYDNVVKKSNPTMTNYLFLDEIQEIKNFEKCVISLFENKKIKFDIYLTGSNSHMFSSSFATLFTGRNKEIKVYPLSFNEIKRNLIKKASSHQSINEYIQYGGMGVVVPSYQNKVATMQILRDVFKDTVHKDIIVRNKIKNKVDFEKIVKFACTNIGNRISANKLENYLKSNKESKITKKTILKYFD